MTLLLRYNYIIILFNPPCKPNEGKVGTFRATDHMRNADFLSGGPISCLLPEVRHTQPNLVFT